MRFMAQLPRRTRNGKRSSLLLCSKQKKLCTPKPILRYILLFFSEEKKKKKNRAICRSEAEFRECFTFIFVGS